MSFWLSFLDTTFLLLYIHTYMCNKINASRLDRNLRWREYELSYL